MLTGSKGPIFRFRKLVPERHDDGNDTKNRGDGQVDHFGLILAVERVVEPGNERSQNEERDAHVVQLGEDLADKLRVAVHRVVRARQSQAQDGTGKEGGKHPALKENQYKKHMKISNYPQRISSENFCSQRVSAVASYRFSLSCTRPFFYETRTVCLIKLDSLFWH